MEFVKVRKPIRVRQPIYKRLFLLEQLIRRMYRKGSLVSDIVFRFKIPKAEVLRVVKGDRGGSHE